MIVLRARNVHDALAQGLDLFRRLGVRRSSRNGEVLQLPEPLCTIYEQPCERVLFYSWRNINPFFGLYESLWMLAGRRDVAPLVRYVKRMADYSDDGVTQNAAYGYRWRHAHSNKDQLKTIADKLRHDPTSRQCVLQIWDTALDLDRETKDHACNLSATFQVGIDGRLDMVVFCRSNDMIWGGWGANGVHFSVLLEYVAARAGLPVGLYQQISVNAHVYRATFDPMIEHWSDGEPDPYQPDPYQYAPLYPYPIARGDMDEWDADCRSFVLEDGRCPTDGAFRPGCDPFWTEVARPIVRAHDLWKDDRNFGGAMGQLSNCQAADWRRACEEWLIRRQR